MPAGARRRDSAHVAGRTTAASIGFTACFAASGGLGEHPLAIAPFPGVFALPPVGRFVERLQCYAAASGGPTIVASRSKCAPVPCLRDTAPFVASVPSRNTSCSA